MKKSTSSDDQLILGRLLSELTNRTDGAVDFWTSLFFWPDEARFDRPAFVAKNLETMRSLVKEIRKLVHSGGRAGDESVVGLVDFLWVSCEKLEEAFQTLEQFRAIPLDQLRTATDQLADAHDAILRSIKELGDAFGCPFSEQGRTAEREEHIRGVLARLFELFREARSSEPAAPGRGKRSG